MITLEDVRQVEQFQPSEEPIVQRAIDATIKKWESETKRRWLRRANYVQRWTLSSVGRRRAHTLFLELRPVETAVIKEWALGDSVAEAETLVGDGDNYHLDQAAGKLIRADAAWWQYFVEATYTGGYVDRHQASPPAGAAVFDDEDVIEVLVLQAVFHLKRHRGDRIFQKSQSLASGATDFYMDPTMHPTFKKAAADRRRRGYGGYG